jgi:hypothetical protein
MWDGEVAKKIQQKSRISGLHFTLKAFRFASFSSVWM